MKAVKCQGDWPAARPVTVDVTALLLKIGQYLTKIWTKLCGLLFWGHPVYSTSNVT